MSRAAPLPRRPPFVVRLGKVYQRCRPLAQTWCSGCHRVDGEAKRIQSDAVPSFTSIAQMGSTTVMSLSAFLSTPHSRMPDYALTRTEIENVSAYILSLRKPKR